MQSADSERRGAAGSTGVFRWTGIVVLVLAGAAACDDEEEDRQSRAVSGEIGEEQFFYECATIHDAFCRSGIAGFPDKIAVGALFDIRANTDSGKSLFVEAASPLMVAPDEGEFVLQRAGFSAFLALASDGAVRDFVHVRGVDTSAIEIQDAFERPLSVLRLRAGQRSNFTAVPIDEEGEVLAGTLSYRWATLDEGVLDVERSGTTIEAHALTEGRTELRVTMDDLELILDVVVEAEQTLPDAGETSEPATREPVTEAPIEAGVVPEGDAATSVDGGTTPLLEDGGGVTTETASEAGTSGVVDADASVADGGAP